MKIDILGTEYNIRKLTEQEYPKLKLSDANGIAELYNKELIINSEMNQDTGTEYANFPEYEKKVIRHEIVHAFFHESGLLDYCSDEVLVNWMALQVPKMFKAFEQANCL